MNYIYCFTNLVNGKQYIGSTINTPQRRLAQHLYHVNHQTPKSNYPIYQAIKKYGMENFKFEVLVEKECSEQEIRDLEHEYIVKYNCVSPNGYNQTDDTSHPLMTQEIIAKVSETKRENAKQVAMLDSTGETIENVYRSIVDCAEATGFDAKKIAACCRGERLTTNEHIFYWIDDNDELIVPEYHRDPYKGKSGTTQVQSSSRKVAKIDLKTGEILEVYPTVALAARENGCDASGISKVCRGVRNQTKGFKWQYVED